MEIISFIATIFFLFLLATPCSFSSSKGGGSENGGLMDSSSSSEVYEIDYRGPETHPSHTSPPDHHSHGRPWTIHHQHQLHHQAKQPPLNPAPNLLKASKVGT